MKKVVVIVLVVLLIGLGVYGIKNYKEKEARKSLESKVEKYSLLIKQEIKNKKYYLDSTKIDNEWVKNHVNNEFLCNEVYYLNDEILLKDCQINNKNYNYYKKLYDQQNEEFEKKYNEIKNHKIEIEKGKLLKDLAIVDFKYNITEVDNCVKEGICKKGTPLIIQVSDTKAYKFYVIEDDSNKVRLILDHNIFNETIWDESQNKNGPIKLLELIKKNTNDWNNILERKIIMKYKKNKSIDEVLRVEIPSKKDITEEDFYSENLDNINGYWLIEADERKSFNAYIKSKTDIVSVDITKSNVGFRPIITLYK